MRTQVVKVEDSSKATVVIIEVVNEDYDEHQGMPLFFFFGFVEFCWTFSLNQCVLI
jgi:hypothetical protein